MPKSLKKKTKQLANPWFKLFSLDALRKRLEPYGTQHRQALLQLYCSQWDKSYGWIVEDKKSKTVWLVDEIEVLEFETVAECKSYLYSRYKAFLVKERKQGEEIQYIVKDKSHTEAVIETGKAKESDASRQSNFSFVSKWTNNWMSLALLSNDTRSQPGTFQAASIPATS